MKWWISDRNPKDDRYDPIYTNYDEVSTIDLKEGEPRTSGLLIYFADHANISSVYTKICTSNYDSFAKSEGLVVQSLQWAAGSAGTDFHFILNK